MANCGSAVRVVAVGDYEQCLLLVATVSSDRQRPRNRVVHRRPARRRHLAEGPADCAAIVGPSLQEIGHAGELHEEELIVFAEQVVNEAIDGAARRCHLVGGHAAAGVEQDPEADRHPFIAEVGNFLPLTVLVHREVVFGQTRDEVAVLVADRGGHVDELDTALEAETLVALLRRSSGRGLGADRRNRGRRK